MISPRSVLGRALAAIGIALLVGGLIGQVLGVKTSVSMSGWEVLPENGALVVSVYTITSSGTVRIEVWNATTAYYVSGIKGDPRSLMKGLQAFNITSGNENYRTDLRLGIIYGVSTVRASRMVLAALPVISQTLRFNIHQMEPVGEGHYVFEKELDVNEAVMLFAIGKNVTYKFTYTVGEKGVLEPKHVILTGIGLTLIGTAILWPSLADKERAK